MAEVRSRRERLARLVRLYGPKLGADILDTEGRLGPYQELAGWSNVPAETLSADGTYTPSARDGLRRGEELER